MQCKKTELADCESLPIPLGNVQRRLNKSPCTLWRWRKAGWLRTVNIAGKIYVTPEALAEFVARLEAGEFSMKPSTPCPSGSIATKTESERQAL